jgi:hypothetical protein
MISDLIQTIAAALLKPSARGVNPRAKPGNPLNE